MSLTGNRRASNRRSRLAKIIAGLNLAMVGAGSILLAAGGEETVDPFTITFILTAIAYSALAALILDRHPGHMVGWILLIIGWFPSTSAFMMALSQETALFNSLATGIDTWLGNVAFFPTYLVPVTLVLQFFPSGRLLSRRWWPLPILTVFALGGMLSAHLFHPWPWELIGIEATDNPIGITGSEQFFDQVQAISENLFGLCILGSLLVVLVRYIRSKGTERNQMKWLVYTASISIFALIFLENVISVFIGLEAAESIQIFGNTITEAILLILPVLISAAIGIAILRHHLFDIDIIIRRTVQYTILTALLALIYFGLVVTLQNLFTAVGGQESPIFIVISTLVIAGLFNPLRRRIQEIIDRRFYRKKYEAEQALDQFAAAARDEVDLDELSTALLGVVQETIQPSHLSLWLDVSEQERSR